MPVWNKTSNEVAISRGRFQGEILGVDSGNAVETTNVNGYDVVVTSSVVRYIRERTIHFYARGLKPGAKVHIFFDGVRVTDRVIPGTITDLSAITPTEAGIAYIRLDATTLAERAQLALDSQALTVASNGTVAGVFYVPANTFPVGDRDLIIADVNQIASISLASTYARQTFFAFVPTQGATRPHSFMFGTYNTDGVTTELGQTNRPTIVNNSNTSQTQSNVWIKLYSAINYGGVSRTFYGPCIDLTKAGAANGVTQWNDVPKSIEISPGSSWVLYQHINRNVGNIGAPRGTVGKEIVITANATNIEGTSIAIGGLSGFEPRASIVPQDPVVSTPSDPIVQTFTITPEIANSREGIYLSSLDLYFRSKDSVHGVSVEVRETVNGFPSNVVLPFGRAWKPAANVNTSTVGNTATTFTFTNLIYLRTGQEYCFTIIPDAHSPNYTVFTAETGQTDLDTGTVVRQDWGNGKMFQATNNRAWTPLTSEDIKFTLKQAVFSTTAGSLVVQNKDYEYFTLTSAGNGFIVGETVFKVAAANIPGSIVSNTSNLQIVGTSTYFSANLAVGDYIIIPNANSSATQWDAVKIANIASNTLLTLARYPRYAVTGANTTRPPVGTLDLFNADLAEMHLVDSTAANSTFLFTNGDTVIGSLSGANAVINVVTNKVINHFQPLIGRSDPASTVAELRFRVIDNAYNEQSYVVAGFNSTNYLDDKECIIASRSNEIVNNSGEKSFIANITLSTDNTYLTPYIDLQNMSILSYQNKISANNTDENTSYGYANSKHISTTVILGANQEAEDLKVYVTAFRPANTDIEVYAKIINASDPEPFVEKNWSKLAKITSNALFSDSSNKDSLIEMEYGFPTGPLVYGVANGVASVNTTSAVMTGVSTFWETSVDSNNVLTVGDVVKVVDPNDELNYSVQRVVTVTSNTNVTLGGNCSFTSSGAKVYKLQTPKAAFLNEPNDKVVRYFANNGGIFDGFRTFALKVVLLADNTYRAPRVADIRSIALSV